MIRNDEVFNIGYIAKAHGLRGEVDLSFTDDCFDTGTADYLVLDMDGILVPFFWSEYRFKSNQTAIIKFDDIDSADQARQLVGHSVFYPKSGITESDAADAELSSYRALTGFTLSDVHAGLLGTVEHVDDSSANILLTVRSQTGNREWLIPFHDDFLIQFDLRQRTLLLQLPEGILTLNDTDQESV